MPFCQPLTRRLAAKYALLPAERFEAQYVIPMVMAMKIRNITSGVDIYRTSPARSGRGFQLA